nr:hypothetical protein [Tanacetum cinerariifolium]GEW11142.1 hypothetical protein [Tanacetum cinerariifolium]
MFEAKGEEKQRTASRTDTGSTFVEPRREVAFGGKFHSNIRLSKNRFGSKNDTFWYILDVYNAEAKKHGYTPRTKNMLTGKWTLINRDVQKFNSNHLRVTDEEPKNFGEGALPRPPEAQRIAKSQRSSNLTASSGSNPTMFQGMMQQQYESERKAKMDVIEREANLRINLYNSQRIFEDMRVLQIDTRGMDPVDTAIINTQKHESKRYIYHKTSQRDYR